MLAKANKLILKMGETEVGRDSIEYFLIGGVIIVGAFVSCAAVDSTLKAAFEFIGTALARAL